MIEPGDGKGMTMTHAGGTAATSAPLRGKVAVVIGGGRGIGRETARRLASAGARVVVAARTGSQLEAVVAEITTDGGEATGVAGEGGAAEAAWTLAPHRPQNLKPLGTSAPH